MSTHDPDSGARPDRVPGSDPPPAERKRRARWLYARVILVQVVALIALWLLQATYGS
jgi:hypothetical protein